ncbi:MAG: biotin--[acetyl-CoA-carboxylase] ligase [Arhodomonas sp.]|nr:biotin--[acetyl-CoA-carboxylase] ligase [Arhodomonas sp.]
MVIGQWRRYRPLDRVELAERLAMAPRELDLRVFREVDSTNAVLRRDPPQGDQVGIAVAERQTVGRGRRGRAWCSPPGGIYLSVSWPYAHLACGPGGLTLTVGVFLAEVLRSLGILRAGVKWPNDIWVDGRKLAGVLTELDGDPMGRLPRHRGCWAELAGRGWLARGPGRIGRRYCGSGARVRAHQNGRCNAERGDRGLPRQPHGG